MDSEAELKFLQVSGKDIVDENGKKVRLHGVNLGGWLMMEGYILGGRNIPETEFKRNLTRRLGKEKSNEFFKGYRNCFINEEDIKNIKNMGFNCVRVPFNYKLIEEDSKPYVYSKRGLGYLDRVVDWCDKYMIYCILDLHSAQGSQNRDWHSDSSGKALLWEKKSFQERCSCLWRELAWRYRLRSCIAGYDVLNEPVVTDTRKLNRVYTKIVKHIRKVDKKHIIFLEGNYWAQKLDVLETTYDDNIAYSIHFYHPIDFTFNFRPGLTYPGRIDGESWNKTKLMRLLQSYVKFREKHNVPIFVGEFGMNSRCPECSSELRWVRDVLEIFALFHFHWAYWTYKAVAGNFFPDGIFRLVENLNWVSRGGAISGWENFYTLLKREKREILESLKTENFVKQKNLVSVLRNFIQ
jgi:aryl-phospho-beta-D-glucosidase BglC (GH1 family)